MFIQEKGNNPIKIRDHPLQRSSSVSAIIHGAPENKSDHYIDALQRFQRDHATVDKNIREKKHQQKMKAYEKRRNYSMERDYKRKQFEENNINKLLEKQRSSQLMYQLGAKKIANSKSIPINPISNFYENNEKGRYQAQLDQQNKLNKLVRAHHITTCGTSGYNLINGRPSATLEELVPQNTQKAFEEKLSKYYSKFRLDPNENPKNMIRQ